MRKKRDGKVKLIALIVVGMLLGGAAGGFIATRAASKGAEKKTEAASGEEQSEEHAGEELSPPKEKLPPAWGPEIINLGEFLLNVDSASGLRYVKCEIAIEAVGYEETKKKRSKGHGEKEGPLTKEQMAWAKDTVIKVFAETPFEQLRTAQGREKLRKALQDALNETLDYVHVRQVLFTSFVMQ